jgi:predicted acylesterase/phospholipase RssA
MNARMPDPRREVRLALVLNGGVSLAIWIGGVTKEIDELRLSSEPEKHRRQGMGPTGLLYGELMEILDQQARVDVISGASAGGINGILLGSAIFSGSALPDSLREIWIDLGDFRELLRSPSDRDPPSLMKGDLVVLAKLRETIDEIYEGWKGRRRPTEGVYLYVTATDLLGKQSTFKDTTGRPFVELDHRRVFEFTYRRDQEQERGAPASEGPLDEVPMREQPPVYFFDGDAPELLARAGRATSSFPVAFEPHRLAFRGERPEDRPDHRWLIDGGVLDNQPFNPVLDRISMLPSELPVRRVVAFVVPYVNEPEQILRKEVKAAIKAEDKGAPEPPEPTARKVYAASGSLPRTLPKLQSLERVRREWRDQAKAESDRRLLWPLAGDDERKVLQAAGEHDRVRDAARNLIAAYRRTRYASSRRLFEGWLDDSFMPGDGVQAQNPVVEPTATPRFRSDTPLEEPPSDTPWLPETLEWGKDDAWHWGLSPAERVAAWALLFLRDALEDREGEQRAMVLAARHQASELVWHVRQLKQALQQRFEEEQGEPDVIERARRAFGAVDLVDLKARFVELDEHLQAVGAELVPNVGDLLCLEVVRHAWDVDDPRVPFPFTFVFMSAGIGNALGHSSRSPETKLAGMQAGHFGGFLKRSWRANDWLWGRIDGVQHVIRATVDLDWVAQLPVRWEKLAAFAFPHDDDAERAELERLWWERLERAAAETGVTVPPDEPRDARASFVEFLRLAAELERTDETDDTGQLELRKLALFRCCQGALAARIQLPVLAEDLERVAETAAEDVEAGSSSMADGVRWAGAFYQRRTDLRRGEPRPLTVADRVSLFRELAIGKEETVKDEIGTRAMIELGSQAAAVATAVFAGNRGGLPAPVRAAMATARAATLAVSGFARLLAGSPAIGAGLLAVVSALIVWGLVSPNVVLGALLPTLIALAIALGYAVLNFATAALEPDLDRWKRVGGMLLLIGLPLAVLVAGATGWLGIDGWARVFVQVFAAAAAGAALARLVFELLSRPLRWRRRALGFYRLFVVGALISYGVGLVLEPFQEESKLKGACDPLDPCGGIDWASVADEQAGLILFAALLGAALLAAILVELLPRRRLKKSSTAANRGP